MCETPHFFSQGNYMKTCTKCGATKALKEFHKRNTSPCGYKAECKACRNANKQIYDKNNKKLLKEYYNNNANKIKTRATEWYNNNKEICLERFKVNSEAWRKNNPDKNTAKEAKRRAKKLQATPKWLTKDHFKQIELEYSLAAWCTKVTKEKYEVDHIIPLQGKHVCGLHVPWNLQVITAKQNREKSNKHGN